ncbi:MAG: hypothetical protein ACOX1S_03925 [Anaerostipes sp.]|jgi:hypothetical protein
MLTIKKAMEIYEKQYPEYMIAGILETNEEWIISAKDKSTGLEIDLSPVAIDKKTGDTWVFFPPEHMDKLHNAKVIDIQKFR